jgi:hypothetical protein
MSGQTKIKFAKLPDSVGDTRIDRLLEKARKASFSRLMATEPKHINLPIPASIILTTGGEIFIFVFTVRNGDGTDPTLYAKTAEIFGPLDANREFSAQIALKYGWADVQDLGEMSETYGKLDSLDVAFYYLLDLRDLFSFQQSALEAINSNDLENLQRLCPPWQMG